MSRKFILIPYLREVATDQFTVSTSSRKSRTNEILSEIVGDKLKHYATVTREGLSFQGRITASWKTAKLYADLRRSSTRPGHRPRHDLRLGRDAEGLEGTAGAGRD